MLIAFIILIIHYQLNAKLGRIYLVPFGHLKSTYIESQPNKKLYDNFICGLNGRSISCPNIFASHLYNKFDTVWVYPKLNNSEYIIGSKYNLSIYTNLSHDQILNNHQRLINEKYYALKKIESGAYLLEKTKSNVISKAENIIIGPLNIYSYNEKSVFINNKHSIKGELIDSNEYVEYYTTNIKLTGIYTIEINNSTTSELINCLKIVNEEKEIFNGSLTEFNRSKTQLIGEFIIKIYCDEQFIFEDMKLQLI